MTQRIGDLIGKKNYGEPVEIKIIKDFVKNEIGLVPKVAITTETYVITLASAGAAGALRSSLFKLQNQLGKDKRLLIRIG